MEEFQAPLPPKRLERIVAWFAEVTQEDLEQVKTDLEIRAGAEIGSSAFSALLGKLFARFSAGVKAASEHHQRIRRQLRQAPNVLIDLTNDLLVEAGKLLARRQRPRGLLLLFDNLNRYPAETIRNLLLRSATLIQPLACHAIFTMPINLHYDPGEAYQDSYGGPAVILPMNRLRERSASWQNTVAGCLFDDGAVEEMLTALAKRIEIAALFEDPEDARLLVKMSGGCMRDLLHLVTLSRQKSRTSLRACTESPREARG